MHVKCKSCGEMKHGQGVVLDYTCYACSGKETISIAVKHRIGSTVKIDGVGATITGLMVESGEPYKVRYRCEWMNDGDAHSDVFEWFQLEEVK